MLLTRPTQPIRRVSGVSFVVLLIVTLTIAAGASSSPGGSLGTLAGTVMDAQGKPLAGATVTMQTSDGMNAHATHTDADGRFEFSRYRPGQYDLRAYARGAFSEWTKRILIRTGKTTEVTLRVLSPDSIPGVAPDSNSNR